MAALGVVLTGTALAQFHESLAAITKALSIDPSELSAIEDIRGSLHYDLVVSIIALIGLVPAAVAIRRPISRARWITQTFAIVVALLYILGLAASPESELSAGAGDSALIRHAFESLLPGWYPYTTALIVVVEVVGLAAACFWLLGSEVGDFYRARRQDGAAGLFEYAHRGQRPGSPDAETVTADPDESVEVTRISDNLVEALFTAPNGEYTAHVQYMLRRIREQNRAEVNQTTAALISRTMGLLDRSADGTEVADEAGELARRWKAASRQWVSEFGDIETVSQYLAYELDLGVRQRVTSEQIVDAAVRIDRARQVPRGMLAETSDPSHRALTEVRPAASTSAIRARSGRVRRATGSFQERVDATIWLRYVLATEWLLLEEVPRWGSRIGLSAR